MELPGGMEDMCVDLLLCENIFFFLLQKLFGI